MNQSVAVSLWGTRIGVLTLVDSNPYVLFEYDRAFVETAGPAGIQLSPLKMPLSKKIYRFTDLPDSFHGVPGLIADSLPDKFGNAVIREWLASQGRREADFNVLDRLCYTGKRGMGALEYEPVLRFSEDIEETVNVAELVEFASTILQKRTRFRISFENEPSFQQLLQLGTSAGGARAKALIAWNEKTNEVRSGQIDAGPGFDYWLMKFDGVSGNGDHDLEDSMQYTLIEYAYYKMATNAGIQMEECRLFEENGRHHFMTKRFDRKNGGKLHMQTLGALAHIDYNVPGLCSYEQAAMYMRDMGLEQSDIEQLFRRMVFNVMAVNQDDHVKNISFLMDRAGKWMLSPAYDITFSFDRDNQWLKAHQMLINGKKNSISRKDLTSSGRNMGITQSHIDLIMNEVSESVNHWMDYAKQVGVHKEAAKTIDNVIQSFGIII